MVADVADRLGVAAEAVRRSLETLAAAERVVHGEFRPGGFEREWCDADVLRRIRRRSLAALRREIEPVDAAAFARFLPAWQGRRPAARGAGRADPGARTPGGSGDPGLDPGARRPARPGPGVPPGRPRRADGERRSRLGRAPGRSGPTTGASRCCSATARRHSPRRLASRRPARRTTRSEGTSPIAGHRSGPSSCRRRGRPIRSCCCVLCGTSCGRARSRTTRSRRCVPSRVRVGGHRERPPGPVPARCVTRGRPPGAGRWSLVADLASADDQPDRARRCACRTTPRSIRRRDP